MAQNFVLQDQCGYWLRAGARRGEGMSNKRLGEGNNKDSEKGTSGQLLRSVEHQAVCDYVAGTDIVEKRGKLEYMRGVEMTVKEGEGGSQ